MSRAPHFPLSLSITPHVLHPHGQPLRVTVKDIGTRPVNVTTATVLLHARCVQASVAGVQAHPASFHLAPGHSKVVTLTVPGAQADYGVSFTGRIPGVTTDAVVAGVGAQVLQGNAVSCAPIAVAAHPVSSGLPTVDIAAAGGIVMICAVIAAVIAKRIRRNRSAAYTTAQPFPDYEQRHEWLP